MKEILQQLANLQYIDSRIDEIKQLRGDLPEEILDIETDIARNEHKLSRLQEEEKSLIVEFDNLKLEITSSEEKVKKYEDQQLTVRNNREYDALTKEIEAQKQIIENSTARLAEIGKRQESIGPEVEEADKNLAEVKTLFDAKRNSLEQVMKSTEEEEQVLVDKRDEVENEVDERYIRNYKRLRNGLQNGIAVVAMDRGAALGMVLPPQTQVEVRRMNKIIFDENSGRIVVDQSFFDNAKKNLTL
ncbi:MAG: zinc ribbon domain-containing protein [Balneolaceae bacterium]